MEIRNFKKKYGLELIPAGTSEMKLTDLVWDGLVGKPKFEHPGMPNNIFNVFQGMHLIDSAKAEDQRQKVKNIGLTEANLAGITVEMDVSAALEMEQETIGKIGANFNLTQAKSFSFGKLTARVLPDSFRMDIDALLDEIRDKNWKEYDGKLRRVFLITELYYGSISISVKSELKADLELAIQNTGLAPTASTEIGNVASYTFSNKTVPFAMRIVQIKSFNG